VPLHNSRGQVIGMAGISIDITQRKQAEVDKKSQRSRRSC